MIKRISDDLTDSFQTNNLLQTREQFFINQYKIESLLENIPQIIYMKDTKGRYITGTGAARSFIKNSEDVLHNIKLDLVSMMESDAEEDRFVLKNNKPVSNDKEIFDISGNRHWYTIYKAPMWDFNHNILGLVIIVKNIDDSRILEAQKETFVASLGHDLKNPTLAQLRAAELLLKGTFGELNGEQKDIIQMMQDSCKYMSAMLSSMLVTYRNESGMVTLNYEKISLAELTEECVGEMIYCAKERDVDVVIYNLCQTAEVCCDRVQIKRVIMNLLSNGIKYAYKNSTLNVSIYNEKNYVCFKFENKSPYIPERKRAAIFAQYVSFARAHNELGIGLGLYASQKIVKAHDGKIFVESFKDDRNIFGFKLPLVVKDKKRARTILF